MFLPPIKYQIHFPFFLFKISPVLIQLKILKSLEFSHEKKENKLAAIIPFAFFVKFFVA